MSNSRQCSVDGCARPTRLIRGMCIPHYDRWRRVGHTRLSHSRSPNPEDRLVFHTPDRPKSGCWQWNGYRDKNGYGVIRFRGQRKKAHRLAYETWVGPIPEGLIVRHKCDNPPCINPEHLEVGTHKDNAQDREERGRHTTSRGVDLPQAKLNEEDVRAIRQIYDGGNVTQKELAERYGLSRSAIGYIVTRKNWRHVL